MEYFDLRNKAETKAKELGLYTGNKEQDDKLDSLLSSLCYDFELHFRKLLENTDFKQGAKAMFDFVQDKAANNWHGNEKINDGCRHENEIATSWIEEAFREVSPGDYSTWIDITTLQKRIRELESELA